MGDWSADCPCDYQNCRDEERYDVAGPSRYRGRKVGKHMRHNGGCCATQLSRAGIGWGSVVHVAWLSMAGPGAQFSRSPQGSRNKRHGARGSAADDGLGEATACQSTMPGIAADDPRKPASRRHSQHRRPRHTGPSRATTPTDGSQVLRPWLGLPTRSQYPLQSELRKHTSLCCLEPGTRVAHAISLLDQPPSVPPIVEEWPGNPENECAYTPGFQATGNTDHLIKAKCQPITPEAGRKSTKEQRCPRESNICDLVQSVRMLEHDLCCHVIDLVMVVRSTTIGLHPLQQRDSQCSRCGRHAQPVWSVLRNLVGITSGTVQRRYMRLICCWWTRTMSLSLRRSATALARLAQAARW